MDLLHRLARELLEREVLDNSEIEKIMRDYNNPPGNDALKTAGERAG
jgi:ATP-dependent Zn protease